MSKSSWRVLPRRDPTRPRPAGLSPSLAAGAWGPPRRVTRHAMNRGLWTMVYGLLLSITTTAAWAQDLVFSAKVDKTAVNIGDPISLTVTLSGDLSGVRMPAPTFPEGFAVLGRSQSTNFSIRGGTMERSTSLSFVLVPRQAGTFTLGPFALEHKKQTVRTEPIEITVKKPALPPNLQPNGERFTL